LLGGLYLQQKRPGEAVTCFEKALGIKPENPELLSHLAVATYHQGDRPKAAALYQRALAIDPQNSDAVHNLGRILFEDGGLEAALPLIAQALQLKPDNPHTHLMLGTIYSAQGKDGRAVTHFRKVLEFQPENIDTLISLGNLLRKAGRSDEACAIYQKIVNLRPTDVVSHINLGTLYHDLGQFENALAQYEHVLHLQPQNVDALISRASLLIELDRPNDATASYHHALQLQPDQLDAAWGKAVAHLMLGEYAEGWQLYETRHLQIPPPFTSPSWNGADISGKRLLIWGEQGLGDVLQFIRYAELCKKRGAKIIVQCRPPLQRLLKNSPFIDAVVVSATAQDFDEHISVMSLPHIFKTTLDTIPQNIPYLFVSDEARRKWSPRFMGVTDYKIGLVWAGNPRRGLIDAHITDRQRSLSLEHMLPLLDVSGCRFYSLQKGETEKDIDRLGLRDRLTDYMQDVEDMMDTAAIIENLDLVLSVDTSVVHLAGGLGKPVWVLSRFGGCWRWLRNIEQNPWYPTLRIFGQPSPGDWTKCIEKIQQALASYINTGNTQ